MSSLLYLPLPYVPYEKSKTPEYIFPWVEARKKHLEFFLSFSVRIIKRLNFLFFFSLNLIQYEKK